MSGHAPTGLIHALVAARHADGIISYVLGLEEMCRLTDAVAVRYNHGTHAQPEIYRGFVESCYSEDQDQPQIPDIPGAIAFHAVRDISPFTHTYFSTGAREYYILDVATNDISLIVPLVRYVPYQQHAPGRSAIVLNSLIELVPYWLVDHRGLGVSVSGSDAHGLRHGDRHFTNGPRGRIRTTVFVRIKWPGYAPWEAQIRMRRDGTELGDSFTFQRLVNQVRGKVRKFITDHTRVQSANPHWAVGTAPGRIAVDDLTLLAIVSVSEGAVMPILKVRDDFVFGTQLAQSIGVASPSISNSTFGSYPGPVAGPPFSTGPYDYRYNLGYV